MEGIGGGSGNVDTQVIGVFKLPEGGLGFATDPKNYEGIKGVVTVAVTQDEITQLLSLSQDPCEAKLKDYYKIRVGISMDNNGLLLVTDDVENYEGKESLNVLNITLADYEGLSKLPNDLRQARLQRWYDENNTTN